MAFDWLKNGFNRALSRKDGRGKGLREKPSAGTSENKPDQRRPYGFQKGHKKMGGKPKGYKAQVGLKIDPDGKVMGGSMMQARAEETMERAVAKGELPIDTLLQIMRNKDNPVNIQLKAAGLAAPYIHPRLAFVQQEKDVNSSALDSILSLMRDRQKVISAAQSSDPAEAVTLDQEMSPHKQNGSGSEPDQ